MQNMDPSILQPTTFYIQAEASAGCITQREILIIYQKSQI